MSIRLTQEELEEYRSVFQGFDRDNNGYVTTDELADVMRALGRHATDEQIRSMIQQVDLNRNGSIEFNEFLALVARNPTDPDHELLNAFRAFDQNGDGFVTADELKRVMHGIGEPLTDHEIATMIAETDLDHDGKINYEEFIRSLINRVNINANVHDPFIVPNTQLSSNCKMSDLCPVYAPFFSAMGCAASIIFTCIGASYGTAKSGVGISAMSVLRPDLMMKCVVPVIMAGIIAIYGLVVSVLIAGDLDANMSLAHGFVQLGAGLSVGLAGLAAGFAIGIVGDAGVRGTAQQPRLYVGMILILIFAEVLGLYGLIVALIMNTKTSPMKLVCGAA
ncbi:H(+)-transporting V0 sector ATPase subunit c [Pleurotus pulmonarius]|nr:H(+)-transporting V0 sector ATPase subunit c [Pleurotus pulmonarius]KAF4591053.1 H(+)-transporting V0 sector ATPase subunit c [Pleurotus pulmonarius]